MASVAVPVRSLSLGEFFMSSISMFIWMYWLSGFVIEFRNYLGGQLRQQLGASLLSKFHNFEGTYLVEQVLVFRGDGVPFSFWFSLQLLYK